MEEILNIHRTEKANSYEFGKADNRIKIYFSDIDDLKKQLKSLEEIGIMAKKEEGEGKWAQIL